MSEQLFTPPAEKKGRGCLFWGCITSIIILVILVALGGVGGYFVMKAINTAIEQATETEPVELPTVSLTPEAQTTLDVKLAALEAGMSGTETDQREFRLNADELNTILDNNDSGPMPFGDWVHLTIEDGEVKGDVSVPIGEILPIAKGRYFNATGTFDVRVENGQLLVFLKAAEMKGDPVPAEALQAMSQQNFAKDVHDPKLDAFLAKVSELRVEGDELVLVLR